MQCGGKWLLCFPLFSGCSLLGDVQIKPSRITYSRNQLMTIKLFGNGPDIVPDLPESLKSVYK